MYSLSKCIEKFRNRFSIASRQIRRAAPYGHSLSDRRRCVWHTLEFDGTVRVGMIILATKQNNNTNRNGRREAFGWTFVGHFTHPLTILEIPDCAKSLIGVPESVILKMNPLWASISSSERGKWMITNNRAAGRWSTYYIELDKLLSQTNIFSDTK